MINRTLIQLRNTFADHAHWAEGDVRKFVSTVGPDPTQFIYAISDDTVKAGVECRAFRTCVLYFDSKDIEDDKRVPQLIDYAKRQVESGRYTSTSTSQTSNLMDRFTLSVWTRIYFYLTEGQSL